ncbi:hypothetical protein [Mesorhizobium sp. SP-1A]|uniref:hypothetical protein n=1 Tax=Mesorhizobium sp. SP-1A TaxID=3077840 RepID=UPI0028F72E29|nr:hypothetical protein [Mesorhizobium sp. SP-1A]
MVWSTAFENMEFHINNGAPVISRELIASNLSRAVHSLVSFGPIVPEGWIFGLAANAGDFYLGQISLLLLIANILNDLHLFSIHLMADTLRISL